MNQNNIKPQELRVNCLVMYKWFEKSSIDGKQKTTIHRETIKILGIDSANNRVLTKTNQTRKNHTWISIDKIRPIPISEEVLLMCPTLKKKTGKYGDYFYDSYYELLRIWFHEKWFIGKKVEGVEYNTVIISENIQNVHELQNIFPLLTQTELEVSL